jgi:type IV pilus assembly protein PilF
MATRQWSGGKNCLRLRNLSIGITGLIIGVLCGGLIGCGQSRSTNQSAERLDNTERKPNYANAAKIYAQLGLGYLSQGQVVRAKAKLTSALEYAPKNAEVVSAWGIYWEHVGDIKESRTFHEKALRLAKSEQVSMVYDAYGSFLCRQGDWEGAQRAFSRALSNRQSLNLAFIYESAGLCAANTQHRKEAEAYLTRAVQMDAQRSRAALALSQLKIKQGDFTTASKWLVQYEKFGPQTPESVLLALQIAKGLNQKDQIENLELLFKRSFHDTPEYQEYRKRLNTAKIAVKNSDEIHNINKGQERG